LKLHTKRSPHERDGAAWRRKLVSALAASAGGGPIATALRDPKAGLVCGASALMATAGDAMARNRSHCDALMARLGHAPLTDADRFVAGTMFWARLDALAPLATLKLTPEAFEPELGQIDGTLAHAVERIIAALAARQGYAVVGVPD
jgi:lipopolysaccharide biosynthesis protein